MSNLAEQLYFSKEAAEYLGITVQRLNKLVQDGKIKPLKKNSSGTVYHIDELNKRKEELRIFTEVRQGEDKGMFRFDTKEKIEALNFATLMNALNYTEKKLEPLFDEFSKDHAIDVLMDSEDAYKAYAAFFKIDPFYLFDEYKKAYKAFLTLRENDEIIKRGSYDYPPLLMQTKDAPRFLYIRGKKSLLFEERTVALVGSRQASENAKSNTRSLADALGKNGITIVSGLAKGIDISAHAEALRMGFNTIAVIGTNLNQYYPSENKEVQLEIERKGLVVSQFSPASKTERWFFPLRNGVMSGLSLATVIMEAGETSGALKQADFALKQGRQILIPESALHLETVTWPAKYVERGAIPVRKPSDVLERLAENNIFQVKREEPVQQTLVDYLEDLGKTAEQETKSFISEWNDPILVED
ncbi:DNA-protecting protein DprA [Butyrivibrio sp. VCD2006]|uniref:DNA-protecting protein DprA n=1 Tax=Butyrivibrio sp. VCD2006 TaxID=1280664 RepID=UPI0003FFB1F3|nr:DNA-protecting protein DprA [Butyrivibrio sp. VCD2006]